MNDLRVLPALSRLGREDTLAQAGILKSREASRTMERAVLITKCLGILWVAFALAACASPPSVSPGPSIGVTPAPSDGSEVAPALHCDDPPQVSVAGTNGSMIPVPILLTCTKAVAAATASLPVGHVAIRSMEFHFGNYCPPGAYCPIGSWEVGFVIFHTGGDGPDLWVTVKVDQRGAASVTSGVMPYPPQLGS